MKGRPSFPRGIVRLLESAPVWVLGSAADPDNPNPKDVDIVVPPAHWKAVALHFPKTVETNKHGGLRFEIEGVQVDIIASSFEEMMAKGVSPYVYCPKMGVRYKRLKQ